MAGNDQVDQDAIAAQWEASLDSEDPIAAAEAAAENELSGAMAMQWAAMVEDGGRDFSGGKNGGERGSFHEEKERGARVFSRGRKPTPCVVFGGAGPPPTTTPAFAPSSIRRWCPTSACR